jgi:hypothetical protein
VRINAYFKVEICKETLVTYVTIESSFSYVELNVFVKISFLSKSLLAVLIGTLVRFLIGMDPQVIKEVMPFSEVFSTVLGITFHYFNCPFGFWVFE